MNKKIGSPFIELKNIRKAYGETPVLNKIDIHIQKGEFLVLVGPSGCGKSTLLRCIAGLEQITQGDLFINGKRANDFHPKDRDLAMVFQSYALYPHMTVKENLGFSLAVRKMKKTEIEKSVTDAAKRLGLFDLLDRFPKQLSGGQRQRVAVGRAIVRNPQAFLFDEPLSNLDAELRGQMRLELKKLHKELGVTMIYVTHDQVEAMTLADRIVVLKDGHVQQMGPPDELYKNPVNQFVARFIGSPPMNFLAGKYKADGPLVVGEGFVLRLPNRFRQIKNIPENVIAGVRPVNLNTEGNGEGSCDAAVEVIEPVGWDAYIHIKIGSTDAVAQVRAQDAVMMKQGGRAVFRVERKDVHLFNPETFEAIG